MHLNLPTCLTRSHFGDLVWAPTVQPESVIMWRIKEIPLQRKIKEIKISDIAVLIHANALYWVITSAKNPALSLPRLRPTSSVHKRTQAKTMSTTLNKHGREEKKKKTSGGIPWSEQRRWVWNTFTHKHTDVQIHNPTRTHTFTVTHRWVKAVKTLLAWGSLNKTRRVSSSQSNKKRPSAHIP